MEMPCEPISQDVLDSGPIVPIEAMDDLCARVTYEEIRGVILKMGNDKALGPDGYSTIFFKKAWSIVGDAISKSVLEFFNNGLLLKQLNHALIALIPKGSHASFVSDYRPISCCNVVYKVISKILANRLSTVLPILVDKD
jgi:hypothetical protein